MLEKKRRITKSRFVANTCVNGDVNAIRMLKIGINTHAILLNIRINQWQVM
jgi:hypothetical protein